MNYFVIVDLKYKTKFGDGKGCFFSTGQTIFIDAFRDVQFRVLDIQTTIHANTGDTYSTIYVETL